MTNTDIEVRDFLSDKCGKVNCLHFERLPQRSQQENEKLRPAEAAAVPEELSRVFYGPCLCSYAASPSPSLCSICSDRLRYGQTRN